MKTEKQKVRDENRAHVLALAERCGWDVEEIAPSQFRVWNGGAAALDFYPLSMRVFDLRRHGWSKVSNLGDLEAAVDDQENR